MAIALQWFQMQGLGLMVLLGDLTQRLQIDDSEERRIISDVSWSQYEALLSNLGDTPHYRVTYLDGVLEIVAPSRRHESGKTRIGTLLEIYFLETDTEYFPTGSTTFGKEEQQAGGKANESYCIDTDKEFPELAIEVVVKAVITILSEETRIILISDFGYKIIAIFGSKTPSFYDGFLVD